MGPGRSAGPRTPPCCVQRSSREREAPACGAAINATRRDLQHASLPPAPARLQFKLRRRCRQPAGLRLPHSTFRHTAHAAGSVAPRGSTHWA